MFKLSKKTEYALLMLEHLNKIKPKATTAKAIAEEQKLPSPMVAKLCQQLAKQGLVRSVQGARGGYALSRELAEISLAQVMEIIEGPISLTHCQEVDHDCERSEYCFLRTSFKPVHQHITSYLNSVTLADMVG